MDFTTLLAFCATVAVVLILKKATQIPAGRALEYLKQGAMVIDVRSRSEFAADHLPQAVNIPLDEIESAFPKKIKSKDQVLLLHCLSGTRSGMAKMKLQRMGYTKVFNLPRLLFGRTCDVEPPPPLSLPHSSHDSQTSHSSDYMGGLRVMGGSLDIPLKGTRAMPGSFRECP
jgi:phage shock protein E